MPNITEENTANTDESFRQNYEKYKKSTGKLFFYLLLWLDLRDTTTWLLLASNIVTIIFAITESWGITNILIVFGAQSVIIGFFSLLRMLTVSDKAVNDSTVQYPPVAPTKASAIMTKVTLVVCFIMFYSLLLFVIFSGVDEIAFRQKDIDTIHTRSIEIAIIIFLINHTYSYFKNRKKDKEVNIWSLFFCPFKRVLPIQIVTYAYAFSPQVALVAFLLGKTFLDMKSYHWERLQYEKPTAEDRAKTIANIKKAEDFSASVNKYKE